MATRVARDVRLRRRAPIGLERFGRDGDRDERLVSRLHLIR